MTQFLDGLGLVALTRGKVISFDRIKGYGFVAPDTGGDDVFIHVNDLYSDKTQLTQGCIVEFRIDAGDRGPKASEVTIVQLSPGVALDRPAPTPAAISTSTAPAAPRQTSPDASGEELCDAISAGEFEHEITEALLRVEPELTGRQILDIRKRLLRIAQSHGWSDR